jgi:uncharacterized protein YbjT (DUF2867 family)
MEVFLVSAPSVRGAGLINGCYGEGAFAPVAAADVGRVIAEVALAPPQAHAGRTYTLTGPAALSAPEVAAVLARVLGYPVAYKDEPPQRFRAALIALGWPEWSAGALVELLQLVRDGHCKVVSDDVKQITGKHTSLEEWAIGASPSFTREG